MDSGFSLSPEDFPDPARDVTPRDDGPAEAVFAGGCFWCTEAVYRQVDGVLDVTPGYAGGTADTANYKEVCSGTTNHAEAIRIRFDPQKTSYGQLLKLFFSVAHDPTQLDRQGQRSRAPVPVCDLSRVRRGEAGRQGVHPAAERRGGLQDAHRDDARVSRDVLRGRGLPPRLRGEEPRAAVHPRRGPAQGGQAEEALQRSFALSCAGGPAPSACGSVRFLRPLPKLVASAPRHSSARYFAIWSGWGVVQVPSWVTVASHFQKPGMRPSTGGLRVQYHRRDGRTPGG